MEPKQPTGVPKHTRGGRQPPLFTPRTRQFHTIRELLLELLHAQGSHPNAHLGSSTGHTHHYHQCTDPFSPPAALPVPSHTLSALALRPSHPQRHTRCAHNHLKGSNAQSAGCRPGCCARAAGGALARRGELRDGNGALFVIPTLQPCVSLCPATCFAKQSRLRDGLQREMIIRP